MTDSINSPGLQSVDALLERQRRRIRGRFAIHGLGWILAAICAGLVVYFAVDRGFELPRGVRLLITIAALVGLGLGFRRRILYPMRRELRREDVAIAIERRFPELREKLISAWQLGRTPRRDASSALVEKVVEEAAAEMQTIPADRVISTKRTARVWGAAAAALITVGSLASVRSGEFNAFLQRALGMGVEYPRLTHLHVELPESSSDHKITIEGRDAFVTLAAGGDLPVLVRAEGARIPREVFLVTEAESTARADIPMARRQEDRFRHTYRRIREDFTFYARGGDDPNGDLTVHVRTVSPPLIGTIEATLSYPAYTGLPEATIATGSIEALLGTSVTLRVTSTAPVEQAVMTFAESGRELELAPIQIEDDSATPFQFEGQFVVDASDRYRIELTSPDGLRNPSPGEYPIVALEDHAPVGRVLLPSGSDLHFALPGAVVPLRIDVRDDFGLAAVSVAATATGEEPDLTRDLLGDRAGTTESVVVDLLPLGDLLEGDQALSAGAVVALDVTLTDNREPTPSTAELQQRQVHIVAPADFARRVAGQFRRLREAVEIALGVQRQRHEVLTGALENLASIADNPRRDPDLVLVEVGQGRLLTSARTIHRGFMQAFDTHLFNGLEESIHAPKVTALWLQVHRANEETAAFLPDFYRQVAAAQQSGQIGAMEKTLDPILKMALRGDRLVELTTQSVEGIQSARLASNETQLRTRLEELDKTQTAIEAELEALLGRLDQWNELQDVVQQARALRDAQRDVEHRTRSLRGEGR